MTITVADIVNNLPDSSTPHTLGGRSRFTVTNQGSVVTIINSRNRSLVLTDEFVSSVCNRYDNLPIHQRLMASQYGDPRWPETPNRVFSAYAARIIDNIRMQGSARLG